MWQYGNVRATSRRASSPVAGLWPSRPTQHLKSCARVHIYIYIYIYIYITTTIYYIILYYNIMCVYIYIYIYEMRAGTPAPWARQESGQLEPDQTLTFKGWVSRSQKEISKFLEAEDRRVVYRDARALAKVRDFVRMLRSHGLFDSVCLVLCGFCGLQRKCSTKHSSCWNWMSASSGANISHANLHFLMMPYTFWCITICIALQPCM